MSRRLGGRWWTGFGRLNGLAMPPLAPSSPEGEVARNSMFKIRSGAAEVPAIDRLTFIAKCKYHHYPVPYLDLSRSPVRLALERILRTAG